MKRNHRIAFAVTAALMVLAMALTGCGTGGGGGGTSTTTFNVGFGGPITKGDVDFGKGGWQATQLAVETANKSQEAKDLKIQFKAVQGDDQSVADQAVTVAKQFVADKKNTVGVVGHFNTAASKAAAPTYNAANMVMISYGSTGPSLTQQGWKYIFRTCATDDLQGPTGADRAKQLGFKTVAIVNDSSPYGQGLVQTFKAQFTKNGGKVVFEDATQQGQTDFTALVTKIAAAKPDLVYFGGTYAPDTGAGAVLRKQLMTGGVTVPMMGGDGLYADGFITGAGQQAEGALATCPGQPVETLPNAKQFAADYKAKFNMEPAPFDAYAYDAAMAIINATYKVAKEKGVAQVTSPAGREALRQAVADSSFDGVTGPIGFKDNGDSKNAVISLYKVVSGKWVFQPTQ